MATDWAFYYLTRPLGLLVIAAAIAIPFAIWRVLLGKSFAAIGMKPLAFAYLAALVGLVLLNFFSSYGEFTNRARSGVLEEAVRWSTVLGWTIYTGVLSLIFVLPVLGLFGVPIAALLLRSGWLTLKSMIIVLLVSWVLLTLGILSADTNFWHWGRSGQFVSLQSNLVETLPGVLLIGLPFLGVILLTARSKRYVAT